VLFAEKDGTRSSSQIMAFENTWEWNVDAERAYEEIVEQGGRVSDAMPAFRTFLGHSDIAARLFSDPVGPSPTELDQAEVPKDLKLLAYLGADVFVKRMRSLQLGLKVIDIAERKTRLTQSADYPKDVHRPAPD